MQPRLPLFHTFKVIGHKKSSVNNEHTNKDILGCGYALTFIIVALGVHCPGSVGMIYIALEHFIIQRASNPRCLVTLFGNLKCIICLLVSSIYGVNLYKCYSNIERLL